ADRTRNASHQLSGSLAASFGATHVNPAVFRDINRPARLSLVRLNAAIANPIILAHVDPMAHRKWPVAHVILQQHLDLASGLRVHVELLSRRLSPLDVAVGAVYLYSQPTAKLVHISIKIRDIDCLNHSPKW